MADILELSNSFPAGISHRRFLARGPLRGE